MTQISRKTVRGWMAGVLLVSIAFSIPSILLSQEKPGRADVLSAMKKATRFMVDKVSNRGGYVYTYAADFSEQWGEIPARKSQIWVQPPGTPSMGETFLDAFKATGDRVFLDAAEKAANALIYGQHLLGGWHYFIDFDPEGIEDYYEEVASNCWGWEEYYRYYGNCTYDDDVQTGPTRFMMNLYLATLDPKYKSALDKALDFVLLSQFPNGAWPQRFPLRDGYSSHYTFNDNVIFGNIDLLLEAYERLGNAGYKKAALRGMDFVRLSQLSPPQAGWCQQFSHDMKPAKARNYEPAAVEPRATIECIQELERYYKITGEKKYLAGIPDAIAWLEASVINRDANKTYEGRPYTHAAFYEPGTNKPIYAHRKATRAEVDPADPNRGYWVDYEFGNFPGHYGMTANVDIDAIKKEFERVKSSTPEDAMAEYRAGKEAAAKPASAGAEKVRQAIAAMNGQGAWLEDVFIPYYPDFRDRAKGKTIKAVRTRTYQDHMRLMIDYLNGLSVSGSSPR